MTTTSPRVRRQFLRVGGRIVRRRAPSMPITKKMTPAAFEALLVAGGKASQQPKKNKPGVLAGWK